MIPPVMRTSALVLALLACGPALAVETKVTFSPVGSTETIPATIIEPDGAGPFPAIVIVHDCSGLGPNSNHAPAPSAEEPVPRGDRECRRGRELCRGVQAGRAGPDPGRREGRLDPGGPLPTTGRDQPSEWLRHGHQGLSGGIPLLR